MSVRILNCDVMDGLRQLADESVHCVVTSPPYWGLRDYGVEGQIGLEATLGEHIARMVEVFREVRRVLRKDGTCWLNYGDCYATSPNGRSAADTKAVGNDDRTFRDKPFSTVGPILVESETDAVRASAGKEAYRPGSKYRAGSGGYLKPKDLCMIPHRLAIALQEDGWWVRADIVWAKPNPMPESIKDRPTKAHEYVFLLTKSERYFYDAEAIKERAEYAGPNSPGSQASPYGQGFTRRAEELKRIGAKGNANGFRGGSYVNGKPGPRTSRGNTKQDGHGRRHAGFNERWDEAEADGTAPLSRNKRSVWTMATMPFPEAHFATFPPELPETCIKAGCPEGGTVLDPFGGAGTTALVADRLQRDAILIELNPKYVAMAEQRIAKDRTPLVASIDPVRVEVPAVEEDTQSTLFGAMA